MKDFIHIEVSYKGETEDFFIEPSRFIEYSNRLIEIIDNFISEIEYYVEDPYDLPF